MIATAAAVRRVRWVAVVFAAVQFTVYRAPTGVEIPFSPLLAGLTVTALLTLTNLGSAAVARSEDIDRIERAGWGELLVDTIAALIIVVLFGFDESSRLWPLLVFPVIEGAMRGAMRGAMTIWALAAGGYVIEQIIRLPGREDPAAWIAAIPWGAGILLFVALGTGTLSERLRDADAQTELEKERLRSMSAIGRAMVSSRDADDIHRTAVETAARLIGWPFAALYEHLDDDRWLRQGQHGLVVDADPRPAAIPLFSELVATLSGPVLRPIEGALAERAAEVVPGAKTVILTPLRADGDIRGLLLIGTDDPSPDLPEDTDDVVAILAAHVTVAMRTAKLAAAEDRTIAELRDLDRVKDDFLSILTHELRSPMTSMAGSASLLRSRWDDFDDETRGRFLSSIERNTMRLSGLIDDVFDALRAEETELPITPTTIDLQPLLEDASEVVGRSPKHLLTLDIPAGLPPAFVDPARVRQIIDNLLTNAVKYSPDGGRITVALAADDRCVRLSVSDEGLGIPSDRLPQLFGRFQRLHADVRSISGTGLGLYLVKTLVDAMGAEIAVESEEDRGTTFTVSFPLAETGRAPAPDGPTAQAR